MSSLTSILKRKNSKKASDEKKHTHAHTACRHSTRMHLLCTLRGITVRSISGVSSGFPWRARRTNRLYVEK